MSIDKYARFYKDFISPVYDRLVKQNQKETIILESQSIPHLLQHIPHPPKKLFLQGKLPHPEAKILCVVGSRKYSKYGEEVTKKLVMGLKGYNICIVSGLALGIDSIAHRTALETGLHTVAFPGSGLDPSVLYPPRHARLAEEILYAGGALISEFEMHERAARWMFEKRNRLLAGFSHATLIIEAGLKSGTMITSKYANDYNRDLAAVPGDIFSPLSEGPHQLIRMGAVPVTSSRDILEMLGFELPDEPRVPIQENLLLSLTENERKIIEYLKVESHTSEELVRKSELSAREINEIVSSLEIQGLVDTSYGKVKLK
ncbi:MAG: DNA-processing protein DprA [Patescibacteria group bacterium]